MINRVAAQLITASVTALLLVSCERATDTTDATDTTESRRRAEPVVVYAAQGVTYTPEFFEDFTKSSGIRVVMHKADDVVDKVVANSGSPPADVLLTDDVTGIWRAADEGALRPVAVGNAGVRLPQWLRDPDGFWVATSFRTSVLAFDSRVTGIEVPGSYQDLAEGRT